MCRGCGFVATAQTHRNRDLSEQPEDTPPEDVTQGKPNADWCADLKIGDSSDQQLVDLLARFDEIANKLSAGNELRARAVDILTEAWVKRVPHGRDKDTIAGSALYIASRQEHETIPFSVVTSALNKRPSQLRVTYRAMRTELNIKLVPPVAGDYTAFLGQELGLCERITDEATHLCTECSSHAGNPVGIAAAALYLAAVDEDTSITLRDAGHAARITKETVWRHSMVLRSQKA
jgi:transcription initiation factor TFIIIB Brf1 subunit/transcription initiation factor TFIIB